MKTNELKKGARVRLRNGWQAEMADSLRGNRRLATVYGHYTETGSIYSHDIMEAKVGDSWVPIEHTEAQKALRTAILKNFGG